MKPLGKTIQRNVVKAQNINYDVQITQRKVRKKKQVNKKLRKQKENK